MSLAEPPKPYHPDRHPGTHQPPPIPPGELAHIRAAAHAAPTAYPGPVGDLIRRELIGWCDVGSRFGGHAQALALADDVNARLDARKVRA